MTTLATAFKRPAPVHTLKYASGATARSGRQVLIRVSQILAFIVIVATLVYALAWVAAQTLFLSYHLRYFVLVHVPENLGLFIGAISAGGLLVSAGHWLQSRPIDRWRLFCILILIHFAGLTLGIARPETPPDRWSRSAPSGM